MFSITTHAAVNWGDVAENVLVPANALIKAAYTMCYVIGMGLIFGSLVQYRSHKQSPTQVRIGQPIMLLIFGIVLLCLPFLAQLSSSALSN